MEQEDVLWVWGTPEPGYCKPTVDQFYHFLRFKNKLGSDWSGSMREKLLNQELESLEMGDAYELFARKY